MKLSVVVPAYNEQKLIGRCLESILNQSIPKSSYEVIVIDNNSTDNTQSIIKKFGITPILYKEKQGAIWAKNFGASKTKGDIIAVTDADSIPERRWLEKIEKIMQDKKLECVGGVVSPFSGSRLSYILLWFQNYVAIFFNIFKIPLIWGSNMAFRKEAFEKVGGFNTNLSMCDDAEFVLRVQKKFGLSSVSYKSKLVVKVSPRKLEKFSDFVPYFFGGVLSLIAIFGFRKSMSFGTNAVVR